jgi:hypothetical protein
MSSYQGEVRISEEAIKRYWPHLSKPGYIEDAAWDADKLVLTWGYGEVTEISWNDLQSKIPVGGLPIPDFAGWIRRRDTVYLRFRTSDPHPQLHGRVEGQELHPIGFLSSEKWFPNAIEAPSEGL